MKILENGIPSAYDLVGRRGTEVYLEVGGVLAPTSGQFIVISRRRWKGVTTIKLRSEDGRQEYVIRRRE